MPSTDGNLPMQLSVSTSPSDPLLAALSPAAECCPSAPSGAPATPFGALFPGLAPSSGALPAPMTVAPLDGAEVVPPPWIGSTQPQVAAPPPLPSVPCAGASGQSITAETTVARVDQTHPATLRGSTTATTSSSSSAKPAVPTTARPTPRASRADVSAQPAEANPHSPDIALALAATMPPPAVSVPANVTVLETPAVTSSALSSDSLLAESSFEGAADVVPHSAQAARPTSVGGTMSAPSGTLVPAASTFAPRRSAEAGIGDDLPPPAAPLTGAVAASAARTAKSAAPVSTAALPSSKPTPFVSGEETISLPSEAFSPVLPAEAVVFADGTRSFAPAEILSRQFAPAPRTDSVPDLASAYNAPHMIAFTSPIAPTESSFAPTASVLFALSSSEVAPAPMVSGLPVVGSVAPAPVRVQASVDSFVPPPANVSTPPVSPTFGATAPSDPSSASSTAVPAPALAVALADDSAVVAPREFDVMPRSERTAFSRGAKIAANGEDSAVAKKSSFATSDKTFVNLSAEQVAKHGTDVGTGVANSEATMSSSFFSRPSAAAVLEHAPVEAASVVTPERMADAAPTSLLAAEPMVAAQRAVEAVLTAVERFSDGERHSVNLSFAMGDTALDVRVELRDDTIHATFRTESHELRHALASQWQGVTGSGDAGERTLRLAAPVFTGQTAASSTTANFSSFAGGDGSSRQRESASRRSGDDTLGVAGLRSRGPRASSVGSLPDSSAASAATRSAPPTSHRLHTLA